MAKIIVVTSGKGGVGKTTTSASFASGLAIRGHKTVVIDFDVGLRNLDLIMGCERRVVYDFVNVINGEATLTQALIKDKRLENLYVLAASQTRDKDALTKEGVGKVIDELSQNFEFVICDSPAGIETGAHLAMYFADEAIVVTNPEVSSVRDSDRMLGLLASKSRRAEQGETPIKEHLLLTRYNPERVVKGEMLGVEDVEEILAIRLLGVIPVMLIVGIFVFSLLHLAPGDPAAIIAGDTATAQDIARIRTNLGLDRPLLDQFASWGWATLNMPARGPDAWPSMRRPIRSGACSTRSPTASNLARSLTAARPVRFDRARMSESEWP